MGHLACESDVLRKQGIVLLEANSAFTGQVSLMPDPGPRGLRERSNAIDPRRVVCGGAEGVVWGIDPARRDAQGSATDSVSLAPWHGPEVARPLFVRQAARFWDIVILGENLIVFANDVRGVESKTYSDPRGLET